MLDQAARTTEAIGGRPRPVQRGVSGASGTGPHRPVRDRARSDRGQPVVHCPDCRWAQVLDEDLHEDAEEALLSWHREHPQKPVDHLAPPPGRLAVPAYVRWQETGGRVAVGDERTGETVMFNHECMAIFRSVAADGGLDAAVTANAHRLSISPPRARGDIVHIAAGLYRKGLLRPAASLQEPSQHGGPRA
ncbi:hypothetical protein [Streptomyces albus]|nr:hypothetical protein [Streptomyces albus]UVN59464.1 hypothetical protein NR995_33575 [Streptomyces albus]